MTALCVLMVRVHDRVATTTLCFETAIVHHYVPFTPLLFECLCGVGAALLCMELKCNTVKHHVRNQLVKRVPIVRLVK